MSRLFVMDSAHLDQLAPKILSLLQITDSDRLRHLSYADLSRIGAYGLTPDMG